MSNWKTHCLKIRKPWAIINFRIFSNVKIQIYRKAGYPKWIWCRDYRAWQNEPNVVALCADLVGTLKMQDFIDENPERFFQVGIAEANMMGIAAGLTIGGKIPFTGTFANFSTGRVYDQIRQSIAYSG